MFAYTQIEQNILCINDLLETILSVLIYVHIHDADPSAVWIENCTLRSKDPFRILAHTATGPLSCAVKMFCRKLAVTPIEHAETMYKCTEQAQTMVRIMAEVSVLLA